MRKRIENLEKQLADYEQHEELSEGEDYILLASEALALLLELCVSMLAVVLLTLMWFASPTVSSAEKRPIVLLALTAGVTGFLISVIVFGRFSTFRRKRSPIQRIALKRSIEKLKERLAQKTSPH
jgi:hypothetical protein